MNDKKDYMGSQPGLKLANTTDVVDEKTLTWRAQELKRCFDSIDYFAEHYFTIIDGNGNIVPIKLYKKQSELIHKFQDYTNVVVCSPRQVGKSVSYSIYFCYQIIFQKNFSILIAANKAKSAKGVLKKIKDAYEQIPNWMKPGIVEWNKQSITFDNGVKIEAEATSDSTGRSGTNDIICLDEFSFVRPSIQESFWESVVPTISSKGKAKLFVVSTPNGVGDKYHEIWKEATSGSDTVWIAHKINWWEVPGRDEAWKQRELKRLGSQEAFDKEYGCIFTQSSTDKLITDDRVVKLKESAEKSDAVVSILPLNPKNPDDKLTYTRYFEYEEDHTYVAGIDCAEGTGQDSSVMYILDITHTDSIKLAAKFDSTKTIPEEFANVIYRLWYKYGKPKIMIETNACGLAVLEALKNLSRTQNDKLRFELNSIVKYNRPAGHTGINSNNQSKSKSMLNLQNLVQSNRYGFILPDDDLYRELPFCEKRSGSGNVTYKALKGHHDDHILALVWGLFILSQELIEKHFTVEYAIDEDTKQKYPVLVLPLGEDIETYKSEHKDGINMGVEEALELAAKWRMLGDEARASFILQMVYDRETEDTGGNWGRNPYQIDQSMFSDRFRKKFFDGKYSDGYFRQPVSDPNDDYIEDNYGFGWIM